jgi:hypothetical protein
MIPVPSRRVLLLATFALLLTVGLGLSLKSREIPDAGEPALSGRDAQPAGAPLEDQPKHAGAAAAEVQQSATATSSQSGSAPASEPRGQSGTEPELAEPLSVEQIISRRDLETEMEAAFNGDQNRAIELGSFLNQCQFAFADKRRVENSVERAARSFAEGKPLKQFRAYAPIQEFDTLQSFEQSQWETFFRCEASREMINESFWDRLAQEADAGNPVARYLFATLLRAAPVRNADFELWDEMLDHREQAREYTWRNLEDREPLGLLALAQQEGVGSRSLQGGNAIGSVVTLAAVKCGLATPDLLQMVDQLLENVGNMETSQPGALERLNAASDEAKRMFCK